MKNHKMFSAALAAVGATMMCGAAFAQDQTTTSTTTTTTVQNGTTATQTGTMDMSPRLSVSDQILIMNLIRANAREIELSRLAVHQAWSKGVSDYAQMMINDHVALQTQLTNSYGNQPWMFNWQNSLKKTYDINGQLGYNWGNWSSGYTTTNGMSNMNQTSGGTTQAGQTNMNSGTAMNGNWDNWMYLNATDWEVYHQLESIQGFPFDKEYIHQMVIDHRMLMEKLWASNGLTSNSDVTTLLNNVQGSVQHHLDEGRRISFNYDDPFHIERSKPFLH